MLMLPKKSFWTTSFPSSRTDRLKFQKQSQKCMTLILLTKNVIIIIEKGRKLHFLDEAPKRLPHIKKYTWKTFGGTQKKVWHGD